MAQEAGRHHMMQPAPRGEVKRAATGYKALQRITVAIRSQVDTGRVLDILAADAGRFLDLDLCSIARWDVAGRSLAFSSEYRREPDHNPRLTLLGKRFEPGQDPSTLEFERVLFAEHMSLISTAVRASDGFNAAFLQELSAAACVVTPIVADQRILGLMVAARPRELPGWSEEEVEFLRTAADLSAVAIQHSALRGNLRVLSAAAAEINSQISRQELLRRLTESAMSITRSTMGTAGVVEGDEMVCREICRGGVWSPIEVRFRRDQGLAGWSWAHRAPCIANDARNDPRALRGLAETYDIRSALTLPVVNRDGEVLGFFELQNKTGGVPYGEEDVHLASALAHHVALALEARKR